MNSTVSPQEAAAAARRILGFYDTIPASDPKGFAAGLVATLSIFPRSVVDRAADPVTGIPSVVSFLNLADIRKHLNAWHSEACATALATRFYAKDDSPQFAAWDRHALATTGKTSPRDRNGGWYFDSEWPPGHQPRSLETSAMGMMQ